MAWKYPKIKSSLELAAFNGMRIDGVIFNLHGASKF
jgi:hypothetical protein